MGVPVADLPPTSGAAALEANQLNTNNPNFVQYVTPNESNLSQQQDQNATAVGNAVSSPVIHGQSSAYNSNVQVNDGYWGELPESCMNGVGCKPVAAVKFSSYYYGADLNSGYHRGYSGTDTYGAGIELVVPLWGGYGKDMDDLAKNRVEHARLANELLNMEAIQRSIKLDDEIMRMCTKLVVPSKNGHRIVLDPQNGSELVQRLAQRCQGVGVQVVASNNPDPNLSLIEENKRLREQLDKYKNRTPVKGDF